MIALVSLVTAAPATAGPRAASAAGAGAVPNEVIVRYKPGTRPSERASARSRAGARSVRRLRVPRAQVLRVRDASAALRVLRRDPAVEIATRNMVRRAYAIPGDPRFGEQWGLHNLGPLAEGFTPDADIDAVEAWDRETGSPNVVIGVVDSGVAYDHPDLTGRIWSNPGEIAGNGLDDDANGYVDDVRGWDVVDEDADPVDDREGHGTHVAGTAAAAGDNGTGIAGVAWNATIMPLRVLDEDGTGDSAGIAEAFQYAAENGAQIVNASLGGEGDDFGQDPLTASVIAAHPNVLFVAAAGNESADTDVLPLGEFPCNHPHANVVCVTATDPADGLAGFANTGPTSVDLGAPGVEVVSTVPGSTPFSEDFESGLDAWTADPPWGLVTDEFGSYAADSPDGNYANDAEVALTLATPFSLAGRADCRLVYDAAWELAPNDVVKVERSFDGSIWTTLHPHVGESEFVTQELDLVADGAPVVYLRFLLDSNQNVNDVGFGVDDIAVRCDGFDDQSYAPFDGTSMATPHVSGAAALLLAADPTASAVELREAILDGGDPLASLAGFTATGRRLNVNGALSRLDLPRAVTGQAVDVTLTSARLTGGVDPRGTATGWQFEWGLTESFGQVAPATVGDAGAGEDPVLVMADLTGLTPDTTYHYRLVATRGGERFRAPGGTFRTAVPVPQPPIVSAPFGSDAKIRCKTRRVRRGRRVARCKASAADAVRVKIWLKRRGRTIAKRSGSAGRYLKLRGRRSVRRGRRYKVVVRFSAADGRRAKVKRKVRL